jgi:senataxin
LKKKLLHACQILAFDGEQALQLVADLKELLKDQLKRCTICVREYHRGRHDLKHELEEQYDTDQVATFMQIFDRMNIDRIAAGLDSATSTLLDLAPQERSIAILPVEEMYALFESMHCTAFLHDESLLRKHFDQPFRLVQTKRKITLPEYTPALTSFLFSVDSDRSAWALRGWKRFKRPITGIEFDWTVRDTLTTAMGRVNPTNIDREFLPVFWQGARVIIEKLDKDLITHHLRALDVDIYKLALDHFQLSFDGYGDIVGSFKALLETSPGDVWDSLAAVPPQAVAEQVLNSPSIDGPMTTTEEDQPLKLEALLEWVDPFVNSIKPANLAPACRAVLQQLMVRLQADKYSQYARTVCWQKGLQVMNTTMEIMSRTNAGSATVADFLELVRAHVLAILETLRKFKNSPAYTRENELGLDVIRNALNLDCHSLASIRVSILQQKSLGFDLNVSSLAIWKAAVRSIKTGDIALASAVMIGVSRLLLLEPLAHKECVNAPKHGENWNNGFQRAATYVVELFERLQDFDPPELQGLMSSPGASQSLFYAVFSGHPDIQQTAATVVKSMGSKDSRRDGVKYIIERYFTTSLQSIASTLREMARTHMFSPCRTLLKLGRDVLDSLCSTQDGILRSRKLNTQDVRATESAWQALWVAIGSMFKCTEQWSLAGHDKHMMIEFCRDAMDFAAYAFNQYSVIAGALRDANIESNDDKASQEVERGLLEMPREASGHVTKWLRLRDEYLVNKAVSITCEMMARLENVDLKLPVESTIYVDDVLNGTIKTKLSMSQKAELRRALENHLGIKTEDSDSDVVEVSKPQKQGSLASWVTSGESASTDRPKKTLDMDNWRAAANESALKKAMASASPTAEMLKARGDFGRKPAVPSRTTVVQPDPNNFRLKRQQEQDAKRKRDLAAIAAAKRVGGSGLQGIGIDGKDHSTKGQGVMVSSDESSEDDDDQLDAELFGVKQTKKRSNTVKLDAAGAIGLKREQRNQPVRIERRVRSAKDMRARLAPDLAPLHKTILGWDFFHQGEYPPNSKDWQFQKVANSFRHVAEYQETFRPLLILEAWQGFIKSREEGSFKPYEIKIVNRSSVDAFVEISSSVTHAENKDAQLSESDIILFSQSDRPTADAEAPHCFAQVYRTRRQKQHIEITYRVLPGNNNMISHLVPGSLIRGTKIQSITPLEREYGALLGLQYYDLCDEIIKARPSPLLEYTDKQLTPIASNYTLNKAQAKAVQSAVQNDAFTLIQGPPGSGKTKTIVAIVGALLTDSLSDKNLGTRIDVPRGGNLPASTATSKKLLVCAPSNAAVDELVMRFKEGIKTLKGVHRKINVVRIGRSDAINSSVVDVTMDELVKKRLGSTNDDKQAKEKTHLLMKEHQNVSEQVRLARSKLDGGEVKGKELSQLQDEFNALRHRKTQLGTQIDNAKDSENSAGRMAELNRKRVQQSILDDAHIICATLSGSGHDMFQSLNIEFETVVVDEAAQCVEMSALIPLKYGCAKCILVGDPRQLPPTVFSKAASANKLEQSMFVRMQNNFPDAVHLLDTQYRMHPDISAFPSAAFYEGRLLDGDNMAGLRKQPWHASELLAPYRFFDVQGQHQAAPKGHSLINLAEIEVAMLLYERLTKDFREYDFKNKIGIITPYKSQLAELKQRFAGRYGPDIVESIEFNTTDAFQGRESEIIIFSCVRASPAGSVGFLSDVRRMNVGITRAKSSLWILGNSDSLARGVVWKRLLDDAQERNSYISGDLHGMLRKQSSSFPAKSRALVKQPKGSVSDHAGAGKQMRSAETDHSKVQTNSMKIKKEDMNQDVKNEDVMEGVRVKLEDRLASIRTKKAGEDVEMADADSAQSGASTPTVKEEKSEGEQQNKPHAAATLPPGAAAAAKPKAYLTPTTTAPQIIRKRKKPADPFMPQPNRKPRTG